MCDGVLLATALLSARTRSGKALDIYVVDVEGGNATLIVAPTGESLLIDTGNTGTGAVRDAMRILAAVRDAGVSKIDHLSSRTGTATITADWPRSPRAFR